MACDGALQRSIAQVFNFHACAEKTAASSDGSALPHLKSIAKLFHGSLRF